MLRHLSLISLISFWTNPAFDGVEGCSTVPANGVIGDFNVSFNLNCSDETMTVSIRFEDYDGSWFGIVLGPSMKNKALIYSTGKSGSDAEALWPYTITGYSKSSVSRDSTSSWEELSTVEDGSTITVVYRASLSDTQWDTSTERVTIRGAVGAGGLNIRVQHKTATGTLKLDLSATTTPSPTPEPQPTASPSTGRPSVEPTAGPTAPTTDSNESDGFELCVSQNGISGLQLDIYRDSENEMVRIHITGPTSKWFGFGFGSSSMPGTYSMIGEGSSFEVTERKLGANSGGMKLTLSGHSSVVEDSSARTLILERDYDVDGTYDFTDFMDCSTTSISFISAKGTSDSFGYHSQRGSGTMTNDCCSFSAAIVSAANTRWVVLSVLLSVVGALLMMA